MSRKNSRGAGLESTARKHARIVLGLSDGILQETRDKTTTYVSTDGALLLYDEIDPKNQRDIWILKMSGERKGLGSHKVHLVRGLPFIDAMQRMQGGSSQPKPFLFELRRSTRWRGHSNDDAAD